MEARCVAEKRRYFDLTSISAWDKPPDGGVTGREVKKEISADVDHTS
jgi:hypothetical protein